MRFLAAWRRGTPPGAGRRPPGVKPAARVVDGRLGGRRVSAGGGGALNPHELKSWLDWYERLDQALEQAEDSIAAYKDGDGEIHFGIDEAALPILREIRDLFVESGSVKVFDPMRRSPGTQVWPSTWQDAALSEPLVRLLEEPAYLAQADGFKAEQPEAPRGLSRLIDVLEAQVFCRAVSERAVQRCPAWPRIVPELFTDGVAKILNEALVCFDLLPAEAVDRTLSELGLPREVMSPFLAYVDRPLNLERLVRRELLSAPPGCEGSEASEAPTPEPDED